MIKPLSQIQWAEIPGFNGLYIISEMGNIFNTKKKRFLVATRNRGKKAWYIKLCYNGVPTHLSIDKLIKSIHGTGN